MPTHENPALAGGVSEVQSCAKQIAPEITPSSPRLQRRKPLLHHEYLLSEIRLARAHASLWVNTLDTLGVALKAGLITPEMAVSELRECAFFAPVVDKPIIAEVGK